MKTTMLMSRVAAAAGATGIGVAACLVLASQPANASEQAKTSGKARATTSSRTSAAIYAGTCGYCHGFNVGPVIRGRNLPPETIAHMVRYGQGAMPAFRPTEITDAELTALAAWISVSKADPKEHGQ